MVLRERPLPSSVLPSWKASYSCMGAYLRVRVLASYLGSSTTRLALPQKVPSPLWVSVFPEILPVRILTMKPRAGMMINCNCGCLRCSALTTTCDSMYTSYVSPLSFFTLPEQVGQLPVEEAQCFKWYDFSESNLDQWLPICSHRRLRKCCLFMKSYLKAVYETAKGSSGKGVRSHSSVSCVNSTHIPCEKWRLELCIEICSWYPHELLCYGGFIRIACFPLIYLRYLFS